MFVGSMLLFSFGGEGYPSPCVFVFGNNRSRLGGDVQGLLSPSRTRVHSLYRTFVVQSGGIALLPEAAKELWAGIPGVGTAPGDCSGSVGLVFDRQDPNDRVIALQRSAFDVVGPV